LNFTLCSYLYIIGFQYFIIPWFNNQIYKWLLGATMYTNSRKVRGLFCMDKGINSNKTFWKLDKINLRLSPLAKHLKHIKVSKAIYLPVKIKNTIFIQSTWTWAIIYKLSFLKCIYVNFVFLSSLSSHLQLWYIDKIVNHLKCNISTF